VRTRLGVLTERPVRAALWALVGLAVLVGIVAALTGLFLVAALVVGLALVNLIYLPRAAAYVRIPVGWLTLLLIPVLGLAGFVLGGIEGAAWGLGLWLVAIGLPRAIGRGLVRRAQRGLQARVSYYDVQARTYDVQARPVGPEDEPIKPTAGRAGRPLPPADGPGRGGSGP
jgi:hypothetical protein